MSEPNAPSALPGAPMRRRRWLWACGCLGAAGLLGAVRWQTAKQVDYNRPMMATNAGGVQPSLIFNLFRGLDVVAAVTAPLILGAPLWVSLAIALVIYFLLRSGANMEEMQEQAKEQQKLLDAERARSGR